jgi:2,4-dienoyl-CoA reductase-like NADH-dependent reductase (Old Yellow Enzyme family)
LNNLIQFEKLFSEFRIRDLNLRNRIVFLPHYTALATGDSLPSENEIYYYAERAKGGAGLIIAGNYAVSASGQMHPTFIDASNEAVIPNFRKTADMVHENGAKIFGQLTHAGPTKMQKPQPDLWAPSQIIEGSSGTYTVEIGQEEMREVVDSFEKSAINIAESDFDGIELKIGHDGILRAFISPHYNKRKDDYGGSFENRLRFIVEVLSAVRSSLSNEHILGIRLCMDEFEEDGYSLDYAVDVAKYLANTGLIDYVNTDAGTTWLSFIMQIPPMTIPLGYAEYMAAALKKEIKLPVIAFGRINDPVQAEQILQNGSADLIGMVRQLVCDPEMPVKAKRGDIDGIRKCIACLDGCGVQTTNTQPIRCIQQIAVGHEEKYGIGSLDTAMKKKRILVVGGGVAGMKAAEIAAKRGHGVVLYEREGILGGQVNLVKKIPYRNEFSEIVRYLEFQLKSLKNVDVRLGVEASAQLVLDEKPDTVIVATGASCTVPKQFMNEKASTGWDILGDKIEVKKKCVIYDQLVKNEGVGIADYLTEYYDEVCIEFYTPAAHPGEGIHFLNQDVVYRKLFSKSVSFFPFYELSRVEKKGLVFTHRYSRKERVVEDYDNFIFVGEMRSNDALYWELNGRVDEIYRIGDARAPRLVELAIHGAEKLARAI